MSKLVFLYVMRGGGYLKVGITRDLKTRLASMNGGVVPFEVSLLGAALVHQDVATRAEFDVLAHLGRRAQGEWVHEDQISIVDIVQTFSLCSTLLPASYRYTFMPGSTGELSSHLKRLANYASSEARAKAARDIFEAATLSTRNPKADTACQILGKVALPKARQKRAMIGPPTLRQWKKAMQAKTMQRIAKRRAALEAAE